MDSVRLADLFDRPQRPTRKEFLQETENPALAENADAGQPEGPVRKLAINGLGLRVAEKTSSPSSTAEPNPPTPEQKPPEKSKSDEVSPENADILLFIELAKRNLSAYETRCLFTLLAEAGLSLAKVVEMTGLRRQHVARALKSLEERRIVVRIGDALNLNRSLSEWDGPAEVQPCEATKPGEVLGEPQQVQNGKPGE